MTKVYCSISKTMVSKNFVPKQSLKSYDFLKIQVLNIEHIKCKLLIYSS
jgi:hypothetical protein